MEKQKKLKYKGVINPTKTNVPTDKPLKDDDTYVTITFVVILLIILLAGGSIFWASRVNKQDAIETRELKVAYLETVVLDSPITEIEQVEPSRANHHGLYSDTFNVKTENNDYYTLEVYDQSVNGAYNFVSTPWDGAPILEDT